jgi:hypothetical protein
MPSRIDIRSHPIIPTTAPSLYLSLPTPFRSPEATRNSTRFFPTSVASSAPWLFASSWSASITATPSKSILAQSYINTMKRSQSSENIIFYILSLNRFTTSFNRSSNLFQVGKKLRDTTPVARSYWNSWMCYIC